MSLQEKIIAVLGFLVNQGDHRGGYSGLCYQLLLSYEKYFILSPSAASFIMSKMEKDLGDGMFINKLINRGALPLKDNMLHLIPYVIGSQPWETFLKLDKLDENKIYWTELFSKNLIKLYEKVDWDIMDKWLEEFKNIKPWNESLRGIWITECVRGGLL